MKKPIKEFKYVSEFNRPSTGPFHVAVYDNGKYDVKVDGVNWLSSGPTFFNNDGKRYCTKEGTLKVSHWDVHGRSSFIVTVQ